LCSSRKYPYLPHGRIFFQDPSPLWKFQLSFIHFFKLFSLTELPPPPPGKWWRGGVWIFSGNAHLKKKKRKKEKRKKKAKGKDRKISNFSTPSPMTKQSSS